MQAHPQSSPAARNHSTQHTPSRINASPHDRAQPQLRASLTQSRVPEAPVSVADHAGLAHDAGNLLGALELYCNLLSLPGVLAPEHSHYASELSLISERSSELIRRLLALPSSRTPDRSPDQGRSLSDTPASTLVDRLHREPAAAAEIFTSVPVQSSTLRDLAPVLKGIAFGTANVTVSCPASLPPLDVAAEVLQRITINLVRNAAQAIQTQCSGVQHVSPDAAPLAREGEIRVSLAITASRLRLAVEDNGPGMAPETVTEFLRPSPLPPGAEHGLGHRIVHELATGSGGQISIRVRPGRGTLFGITWPIPSPMPHSDSSPTLCPRITQRGLSTC